MSEEKDFFIKFELSKFDRVLFTLIILSHVIALFEPVKHLISENFTAETGLIVYLVAVTAFWTIFIAVFCSKQVKEKQKELLDARSNTDNRITTLKQELSDISKTKGYAEAYEHFGLAFAKIHQMQRYMVSISQGSPSFELQIASIVRQFEQVCTHIADAFNLVTGRDDISVCIKLLNGPKEMNRRSSVYTLARDSRSVNKRAYPEASNLHIIENNTSYAEILRLMPKNHTGRCFICNNLPQLSRYRNTSFSNWGQAEWKESLTSDQRERDWLMPYRSTIVTGIYPNQVEFYENKWLVGYICIDSNKIDAFHEKYDASVLTGIADGMYNTLKQFKHLKDKKNDKVKGVRTQP